MWKVVQVGVRRAVGVRVRRVPAAARAGSVRGSEAAAARSLTRQLCSRAGRSCTVDPGLEEQFVFVDCTDPEEQQRQEDTVHQLSVSASSPPLAPPPHLAPPLAPPPHQAPPLAPPPHQAPPPPQTHLRSLERQLQVLRGVAQQGAEPDSLIQFHDVDFPLDQNLLASAKKKKKKTAGKGEHKVFGTPDVDEPLSDTSCSGCGALLHCAAATVPGYLPSEKFKALRQEGRLGGATCQRCHLLTHHHKALGLQITADQYRAVVQRLRPLKALVLLIVDLLDLPDSIVPGLPDLIGTNKHVVVLGNKVDLLPADAPNYLQRIRRQLARYCQDAGFGGQVTDVHLISAKTGFGVEGLISSLQRSWRYQGDVYLVGSANAGKSTLFNTLLDSDYCKSKASDLIHKATISPWPGTTLDLLKFPIINPTPNRMFRRQERLNEAERQTEDEMSQEELQRLRVFSRKGYLVGRVGRTFRSEVRSRPDEIEFDFDSLAFGENEDEETTKTTAAPSRSADEFTFNELKDAHWLYDTPGIIKEHDILALLTEQEVMSVVPSQALVPRTFVLKPGMSLFLGALARIDFLQGGKACWFSVAASGGVPVHITGLEKADGVYEKHAGHTLLGVPLGGSERMKEFPALVPQEFRLEGGGYLQAAADIKLSSAGWVAVTAAEGDEVLLRVYGPVGASYSLRTPPLLPHIVSLKGERIRRSPAYRTLGPGGPQGGGAPTLQGKKKKKKT